MSSRRDPARACRSAPFLERHGDVKDRTWKGWHPTSGGRPHDSSLATAVDRRLVLRLLEQIDSTPRGIGSRHAEDSQSTLAAMIGVSRENVNRAWLSSHRMADPHDGGRYVLVDEGRLRREVARGGRSGGAATGRFARNCLSVLSRHTSTCDPAS